MLIGHSSGAHLSIMAVLELLHDDILNAGDMAIPEPVVPQIHFEESHYRKEEANGQHGLEGSSGSSGSFCVLNENGDKKDGLEASNTSSTFEMLSVDTSLMEESVAAGYVKPEVDTNSEKITVDHPESVEQEVDQSGDKQAGGDTNGKRKHADSEEEDAGSEQDSVITVRSNDKQRTLVDIGKSIKAVIGMLMFSPKIGIGTLRNFLRKCCFFYLFFGVNKCKILIEQFNIHV